MSRALRTIVTGPEVEASSDERFGLLMSIQPRFAEAILAGTKTVELRRRPPRDVPKVVIIYGSGATRAVIGVAQLEAVHTSTPDEIWKRFGRAAGVTRAEFYEYFAACETASALELTGPRRSAGEITLNQLREVGLEPPQSWRYVERQVVTRLLDELALLPSQRTVFRHRALSRVVAPPIALADLGLAEATARLSAPFVRLIDSARCVAFGVGKQEAAIRPRRRGAPTAPSIDN